MLLVVLVVLTLSTRTLAHLLKLGDELGQERCCVPRQVHQLGHVVNDDASLTLDGSLPLPQAAHEQGCTWACEHVGIWTACVAGCLCLTALCESRTGRRCDRRSNVSLRATLRDGRLCDVLLPCKLLYVGNFLCHCPSVSVSGHIVPLACMQYETGLVRLLLGLCEGLLTRLCWVQAKAMTSYKAQHLRTMMARGAAST